VLHSEAKYPVLGQSDSTLSILYTNGGCSQPVEVARAEMTFIPLANYQAAIRLVLEGLERRAEPLIAAGSREAAEVFRRYNGEYSKDTAVARAKLADECDAKVMAVLKTRAEAERIARIKEREELLRRQEEEERQRRLAQEKFEAEQKAKGLVDFEGQWITPAQVQRIQDKRRQAGIQPALEGARKGVDSIRDGFSSMWMLFKFGGDYTTKDLFDRLSTHSGKLASGINDLEDVRSQMGFDPKLAGNLVALEVSAQRLQELIQSLIDPSSSDNDVKIYFPRIRDHIEDSKELRTTVVDELKQWETSVGK